MRSTRRYFAAVISSGAGIGFVPRFVSAIHREQREGVAVVLDHTEAVTNPECRGMIAEFAVRLPQGWRLALASRTSAVLPSARLRVQGSIVEVGMQDLAMEAVEASALLNGAGVNPGRSEIAELVQRTEGWPAGLYLAALAIRAGARDGDRAFAFAFAGDDRFMRDYLRSELLGRVPHAEVSFLTRTSILDRMCGALCDATLDEHGSAEHLDQLEERNLLVVPLDRRGEWYRYHHLLRDWLQAELRRREPDIVKDLHLRAAAWYEENGSPETAIEHAQAAGDVDRVARLVLDAAQPAWASGRVETVLRWMEWLRDKTSARHYPAIAVHGALIFALLGQSGEAERWAIAAERAAGDGARLAEVLPDGSSMESTLAYLRAILARDGVQQMRNDARLAWDGLSPASPYRATMLHSEAISYLLEGRYDAAEPILARAFDFAVGAGSMPVAAMLLAERCYVAASHEDWPEVSALSRRAVEIVEDGGLEDYWTSALVYAWAARDALRRHDLTNARNYLNRGTRLRPLLTYALPVVSVQALLELARCYIALADRGGATTVLGQVHYILQQRPNLGNLGAVARDLQSRMARIDRVDVGPSSLTSAELRLAPLLSTHLTFREIAERLSVSFHTVKSQSSSIYQKLAVSSRSDAVNRLKELGLGDE